MSIQNFQTFEEKPPIVQMSESRLCRKYVISWGNEKFVNDLGVEVFKIYSIELGREFSYGTIISAIIALRYSNDEVTAISLNYLYRDAASEAKSEEYAEEYQALQEWRSMAKVVAAQAVAYAKEQQWIE